jgi:uncharacterized protein YggT (Ycf19 family)
MRTRPVIRLILFLAIVALFLHQRFAPHSSGLSERNGRVFRFVDRIFGPLLKFLREKIPPLPVSRGLSLESSHLTLLIILLTALTVL